MNPSPPPEYANNPNLWRLACELSKFKNPRKAADLVLSMAGTVLEREKEPRP